MSPARRSVSPFGSLPPVDEPFSALDQAIRTIPSSLDISHVPPLLRKIYEAAANDAPELPTLCQFLAKHKPELESCGLFDAVYAAMLELFDRKIAVFLIDGEAVLFSRERDILIGRYFSTVTENNPGKFSEFLKRWTESESFDPLLHFLDFSMGSKNPTFEHYLLFSHSALQRLMTNKTFLRSLLIKTQPVLAKLSSPDWETKLKKTLNL